MVVDKNSLKFSPVLKTVFGLLLATFVFIACLFIIPVIGEVMQGLQFLIPFIIFAFLGLTLIFLTIKQKVKGRLRKFLLLTGGSAVSFLAGIVLHNLFYAVGQITIRLPLLHYLSEILHTVFFFIAIPASPLCFLVGALYTIILLFKQNKPN